MIRCRLKVIFAERNIKQIEFAKLIGVANSSMSAIANGRVPTLDVAMKIAEELGMKIEDIWVREQ